MSVLLLVRHGQASFGADDYDALSPRGHEQAEVLGRALAARGVQPDLVVRGGLRRHRETVDGLLAGLGPSRGAVEVVEDPGWDEFDFGHVMEVHTPRERAVAALAGLENASSADLRAHFQQLFEEATARWTSGDADHEYDEPFPAFAERVDAALRRTAERAGRGGTVVVVSSGGPIGLVASHLLAGDASLWAALNRVAVNTAVTKVLTGRSGLTLSSFNEHAHLEHDRALVTYR